MKRILCLPGRKRHYFGWKGSLLRMSGHCRYCGADRKAVEKARRTYLICSFNDECRRKRKRAKWFSVDWGGAGMGFCDECKEVFIHSPVGKILKDNLISIDF